MIENKNYALVAYHVKRTNTKHRDDFYNVYSVHFDEVKSLCNTNKCTIL